MSKPPIVTAAGEVRICHHAIDRYIERVKPAYTPQHAHWELVQLLPQAVRVDGPLGWGSLTEEEHERDCYLVLADSIAFPVFGGVVITTVSRGQFTKARAERDQRRRERRATQMRQRHENDARMRRERKAKGVSKPRLDEAA